MKKLKTLLKNTFKEFRELSFAPRRYIDMEDVELESKIDGINYRLAERKDIVEMLAIERDVYSGETPWTFSHFEHEIAKSENSFFVVAEISGKVIGFIGTRVNAPGDHAHITNLAVSSSYQRQGIGGTLIKQLLNLMTLLGKTQMTLEVHRENTKAQGIYRRLGFATERIIPKYYEDGDDAVWMVKQLRNEHSN